VYKLILHKIIQRMRNKVLKYLLFSTCTAKLADNKSVRNSQNHKIKWGYEHTKFPLNMTSEIFYDDEITMLCPSGPFRLGLTSFSLYLTSSQTCEYDAKTWKFLYNCNLTASNTNPDIYSFHVREPYLPIRQKNKKKGKYR
jgi:hypothetical protein